MKSRTAMSWAGLIAVASIMAGGAHADQVIVIAGGGFAEPLKALAPAFEARTGHKVQARYGTAPQLVGMSAEPFDVIITPEGVIGVEATRGRFPAAAPAPVAKVDIGIAVLKGAPRPDIRTTEGLKQALLKAKGVSSIPASATGAKLDKMYQKLGIADAMKSQLRPQAAPPAITEAVAKGEAEVAIFTLNVLATDARLDVVGPVPDEVQDSVVYYGSTATASKVPAAAQALLEFLKTPDAAAIIRAKGMTPG